MYHFEKIDRQVFDAITEALLGGTAFTPVQFSAGVMEACFSGMWVEV